MQKTLMSLIAAIQTELYQGSGPGVQVYSQDRIAGLVNQAYEHCIKQEYYPQFRKRETRTLDGVTGQVTAPFTYIKDWEDVQHVFRSGSDRPLPIIPANYNTLDEPATASTPRYIEASGDDNLFRVYPASSTGSVLVVGRQTSIATYGLTDVVPFDHLALIHYSAWSYFTDDGSNPASAMKHQGLFETRMKKIKDESFGHSVELNPGMGYVPDRWYER